MAAAAKISVAASAQTFVVAAKSSYKLAACGENQACEAGDSCKIAARCISAADLLLRSPVDHPPLPLNNKCVWVCWAQEQHADLYKRKEEQSKPDNQIPYSEMCR